MSTAKCDHCARTVNSVAYDLGFDFKGYVNAPDNKVFLDNFLRKLEREIGREERKTIEYN